VIGQQGRLAMTCSLDRLDLVKLRSRVLRARFGPG
jgi:hypothetical protein